MQTPMPSNASRNAAEAASGFAPENDTPTGILLVSFGLTTRQSKRTLRFCEQDVRRNFPGYPLRWAFTSRRYAGKTPHFARKAQSIAGALSGFAAEGVTRIAVQPLHLVPGAEHTSLAAHLDTARKAYPAMTLVLGKPLVADEASLPDIVTAMREATPRMGMPGEAFLWVGHGSTGRHAWYEALAAHVLDRNVPGIAPMFMGCLTGRPCVRETLGILRRAGIQRLCLSPFFAFAGNHAAADMGGKARHSWQTRLEAAGISCRVNQCSLAETEAFLAIWRSRLCEALASLNAVADTHSECRDSSTPHKP